MKQLSYIPLLILPLAYALIGFHFNDIIGLMSLRNVDPEYVYLTNGLYLSLGHLDVPHIDNPGTPLQILVALVCRIVYLFRPHELPYLEDVFLHSDFYLNVINNAILVISAIIMFLGGIIGLRITRFLPFALIVQTIPFYSNIIYDIIGRVTPELLFLVPLFFLTLLMLSVLYSKENMFNRKFIIWLSMVAGFGLAIKITYFPVVFVPFFIIPGWKKKIQYIVFSFVALCLFAFPILFNMVSFFGWIGDLFVHSGQYGGGEANFIVWDDFKVNLYELYRFHKFLIVLVLLNLTVMILNLVMNNQTRKVMKIQIGVFITLLLQVFLVSKHYEYRYLVPALGLIPLLVILLFHSIPQKVKFQNLILGAIIVVGLGLGIRNHHIKMQIRKDAISQDIAKKNVTKKFVDSLPKDATTLITPDGYGCPYHDFSMMISHCWAGRANKYFLPVYMKLYPDTWFYFTWEGREKYWEEYNPEQIINSSRPVYFYIAHYTKELYDISLKAILKGNNARMVNSELIFENSLTNERIYQIRFKEITQ